MATLGHRDSYLPDIHGLGLPNAPFRRGLDQRIFRWQRQHKVRSGFLKLSGNSFVKAVPNYLVTPKAKVRLNGRCVLGRLI
jgi:hypothetical protein